MKKLITITLFLVFFNTLIFCMTLAPARIYACPECGGEKELMSLASGNTFGARQWSDGFMLAPMLPRLSPVQKCPHCGAFFMLPDEPVRVGDNESFDTGKLTFPELKQAYIKLKDSGLPTVDEISLRLCFVHSFNDAFRNLNNDADNPESRLRDDNDTALLHSNFEALIILLDDKSDNSVLLSAEFCREAGRFDDALKILDNFNPTNNYIKKIAGLIKEKALVGDSSVFEIN